MPFLTNPLGLLALFGIPAVLAIHFLQRKSIVLPVSTLFLLERTQRDAASGRRFERIVPSIPLWMQLLAVLLLAWFLAEPRFRKPGSVQRIAIVLDSSSSMQVFKKEAVAAISADLPNIKGSATTVEFTVLESAPGRPRIYAGSSVDALEAALGKWSPLDGRTDPTQALRLARSLVSREGTVIYLTDTPADALPFDARLLAVGSPIENAGFTGVDFATEEGTLVFRALVRNYSASAVDRSWSIVTSDGATQPRPLHLDQGALATLQSAFPSGARNVRIVLSADRFILDDTLPLVAPAPKQLALFAVPSSASAELKDKLLLAISATVPAADANSADLTITSISTTNPALPTGNSISFVDDNTRDGAYLKGAVVAENHPLLANLNWQSLLVRESSQIERKPEDSVILWQDKRPLIFLRENPATAGSPGSSQLLFNFDLRHSNAASQPAFIVLLHRFAESIRDAKVAPSSAMLETGQPLRYTAVPGVPVQLAATDLAGNPLSTPTATDSAPLTPGFLTISQNKSPLLDAAVYFADTREADFSTCGRSDAPQANGRSVIERHTKPDPLWRIWILLLIAVLLVSWKFNAREAAAA